MNMTLKKAKSKGEIKDDFSIAKNESMDIGTFSEGELKLEGTLLKSFSFDNEENPNEHIVSYFNDENTSPLNLTNAIAKLTML